MRVRGEGPPPLRRGQEEAFTIHADGRRLALRAQVMWVRRAGIRPRRFEIGLRFDDQRPAMRRLLEYLGEYGFFPKKGEAVPQSGKAPPPITAAVEVEDLYAALDLPRDADEQQIKARYRELAHRLHPDRCAEPDAAERFAHVSKCYRVLRDPSSRARYDELLNRSNKAA